MNIGTKMKKIRKEKGMTLQQVADIMRCSPQLISQYENGKRIPKRETIHKIADALNIPDIFLLEDDEGIFDLSQLESEDQISMIIRHIIQHPNAKHTLHNTLTDVKYSITAPSDKDLALKKYLLLQFEELNDKGKNKLTNYAEDLVKIKEYQKEPDEPPQD